MTANQSGTGTTTDDFDDIDLGEILRFLQRRWLILLTTTLLGGALGIAVSFILSPRYKADALLIASDEVNGADTSANLSGPLGGLAAIAGIGSARRGQLNEGIATLKSRILTERYIAQQNLLPVLFSHQWNSDTQRWQTSSKRVPTYLMGYRLFDKIRTVTEDRKTGLVTISIEWTDPQLAAKWTRDLVDQTNEYLRAQALERANRDLSYLNDQLKKAAVVELRAAISKLIEAEIKKAMVAEGNPEYAFHFIDPPVVPDKPVFPKRVLFLLAGLVVGFSIAVLFTYSYDYGLANKAR
jgi:uncharacterized protein involved in exopolysaccharide biosynthesis